MPCCRLARACLTLTALIAACSAPGPDPAPADAVIADAVIYVVHRHWHTDIGLPVKEIEGPLATVEGFFPGVRFLIFGFGERQFLVNQNRDIGAMINALLPSQSALLMTALSATPDQAFGQENVVVLRVPRAGLDRIVAAIWQEFELAPAGGPILLADGPYPGSVFYAARDTYDGLYTCNSWTADILRSGGLPMPVAGVLFAGQVMGMVRWIGAHQAPNLPDRGRQPIGAGD
jgi:uncharacterized protein (TIGR02117 family)